MDLPPTALIDAVRRSQSWANISPETLFSTALRVVADAEIKGRSGYHELGGRDQSSSSTSRDDDLQLEVHQSRFTSSTSHIDLDEDSHQAHQALSISSTSRVDLLEYLHEQGFRYPSTSQSTDISAPDINEVSKISSPMKLSGHPHRLQALRQRMYKRFPDLADPYGIRDSAGYAEATRFVEIAQLPTEPKPPTPKPIVPKTPVTKQIDPKPTYSKPAALKPMATKQIISKLPASKPPKPIQATIAPPIQKIQRAQKVTLTVRSTQPKKWEKLVAVMADMMKPVKVQSAKKAVPIVEFEVRKDAKPLWANLFKSVSDLVRHAKGDLVAATPVKHESPKPIEEAEEDDSGDEDELPLSAYIDAQTSKKRPADVIPDDDCSDDEDSQPQSDSPPPRKSRWNPKPDPTSFDYKWTDADDAHFRHLLEGHKTPTREIDHRPSPLNYYQSAFKPYYGLYSRNFGFFHALLSPSSSIFEYIWNISHKSWNKLMHALHGNGVITRLYTEGMPHLSTDLTPESFISWTLDFKGWCISQGMKPFIIERASSTVPLSDEVKANEAEGLRYLCAAIDDPDLRTNVALNAQDSGITGYKFLTETILQGAAVQPTIQAVLDNTILRGNQTAVAFRIKFSKLANALDPKPSDRILTTKFANAVLRESGDLYESCVSAASAAGFDDDLNKYANLLTKLITEKQARLHSGNGPSPADPNALQSTVKALQHEIKKLQQRQDRPDSRQSNRRSNNRSQSGNQYGQPPRKGKNQVQQEKRPCRRCAKTHPGGVRDCRLPTASCDFILPNGQRCQGDHHRSLCFFEDPSRCHDPKIRALVQRKLDNMNTNSANITAVSEHFDDESESLSGFMTRCFDCEASLPIVQASSPPAIALTAGAGYKNGIFIDTAASHHIIRDPQCIIEPEKHIPCDMKIMSGNGSTPALSTGPATFIVQLANGREYSLTRQVIFAPEFGANLFSISQEWADHATTVEFDSRCRLKLIDGAEIPFDITNDHRMYVLPYKCPSLSIMANSAELSSLFHRRMGHQAHSKLLHLPDVVSTPTVNKLNLTLPSDVPSICDVCPQSRLKHAAHGKNRGPDKPPLVKSYGDVIHMDLAGPLPTSFPHQYRYCDIFIDEYSLHIGGFAIRQKSNHEDSHIRYCAEMASYGGMEIKHFHSDNGGEYVGKRYCEMITSSGAHKTTIMPRRPNMNPIAEGAFFRIFSIMRALLIDSGLPRNLWPYAFYHTLWILNRTPRFRNGKWTTSYELVTGRRPNIAPLRLFGCKAYCLIDRDARAGKLGAVSFTGWHIGIARTQRGWHIYCPDAPTVTVARTVRFDEKITFKSEHPPDVVIPSTPPKDYDEDDEDDAAHPARALNPTLPAAPNPPGRSSGRPHNRCRTPGCTQRIFHEGLCGPLPVLPPAAGHLPSSNLRARAAFSTPGGAYLPEYINDDINDPSIDKTQYSVMVSSGLDEHEAAAFSISVQKKKTKMKIVQFEKEGNKVEEMIPRNVHEAMKSKHRDKWLEAMNKEMESHLNPKIMTWEYVPEINAKGRKLVGSTWAYDIKRNKNGTIARFKARLCAQGFSQVPGVDYTFTYSNTIRHETLRALFAIAAHKRYRITGGDIKTAYLHGRISEAIYMRQPAMFEKTGKNGERLVCKLNRSIYGLRQSGACWEAKLAEVLTQLGLDRCDTDPCLWKLKGEGDQVLFLAIYVDDLVVVSSNPDILKKTMDQLEQHFEVTGTGNLEWVLGMNIEQSEDFSRISIDQKLFIRDLLLEYSISADEKGRATPSDASILALKPLPDDEEIEPKYQSLIGKLMWLTVLTRPDIAFTTAYLSRFASKGGKMHMEHAIGVLKYLSRTTDYRITYTSGHDDGLTNLIQSQSNFSQSLPELLGFTDSSYGGERPPAGYLISFYGGPVSFAAYRLPLTPLSSAEAEYVAATRATTAIIAVRAILDFLGQPQNEPTIIFCDNKAAIQLSDNDTSSKRMKHVATRIAFLREQVQSEKIMLYHISTLGMCADIFTKPLTAQLFHVFRSMFIWK